MRDRYLNHLGAHSYGCGDQHPEERRRTAQVYREGHTGNVAGTYRAREGCGKRLKVRGVTDIMRVIILARGDPDGMTKIPDLWKAEIDSEKHSSTDKQYHEPGMPSEIPVKIYKKIIYTMHTDELCD